MPDQTCRKCGATVELNAARDAGLAARKQRRKS